MPFSESALLSGEQAHLGHIADVHFLLMIPSCIVFADELFSFASFFYQLGPFYMFALLLEGISNIFAYLTLHREIRDTARAIFCRSRCKSVSASGTFLI